MSITLSLYDIFSYTVPGVMYFYAINELLGTLGKPRLDILQISTVAPILSIAFLAFVLGHLATTFTYKWWYRLFVRTHEDQTALDKTSSRFPELKLGFKPADTEILFAVIQVRSKELADRIESYRANAIMMRNISFGFFLMSVVELTKFFTNNYVFGFLATAILYLISSGMAISGASRFYEWFYRGIFRTSSVYGSTYQEVVKGFRKELTPKR